MADRSSKAKKAGVKKQRTGIRHDDGSPKTKDLVTSELLHGLSEKEVEIDHLKTTVVSLDTKVKLLDDVQQDRDNARDYLK